MKSKGIQFLLAGVAACIGLVLMITEAYGASIVIGGNYIAIDRMTIVSPNPGDTPKANGTALLNILDGIPWNNGSPYLIKLGPGTYDIGTSTLIMKPLVDVEGSGVNVTTITGNPSSSSNCYWGAAVVYGSEYAEIRSLTVKNVGASSPLAIAVGILNDPYHGSSIITDVSVSVDGSGVAFAYGVVNCNTSPEILNVRVDAHGSPGINRGIYNAQGSIPIMKNVYVYASGGVYADGIRNEDSGMVLKNSEVRGTGAAGSYGLSTAASSSSPNNKVENSFLSGDTYGILNGGNVAMEVFFSEIYGGVSNIGNIFCFTTYSLGGNLLDIHCQ